MMPQAESRVVRWVRRVLIGAFALHMVLFFWSIYRRIWQVTRVDLQVSSATLSPGVKVSTDVITSGETQNRIRLELVQGTHSEVLMERRARVNVISAYDPRRFRYTPAVTITPQLLARFTPGPATLRLTGFGGQKLLRTPAPRVRELPVTIPAR
jgi:hypothetical protein